MSDQLARLLVQRGPDTDAEFVLSQPMLTIGRSTGNDIVIPDAEVSRQHARLIQEGDSYLIEDLGSTNGVFINGRRISNRTQLYHGDTVELGETIRLRFARGTAAPPAPPPSEWETSPELVAPPPEPVLSMAEEHDTVREPPPEADLPQWLEEIGGEPATGEEASPPANRRRWFIGCGCVIFVLVFLCFATFFFLDAYDNGRLLYCGPLNGLFQFVLGPFGFNPACG